MAMNENPANPQERDMRLWGMLCHLSALALFILPAFGNIIGPLAVWLIKKDQYPFVYDQGKESLNFQISVWIYAVVSGLLIFLVIGIILLPLVMLFWLVETIIAAIRANNGEAYRYPLTIRFIS